MNVEFHPAALREVEDAQAWYEERSLFAASAFLRELSTAVQQVRQAPHRYPNAEGDTRRILLDRFPFTIYYRVKSDDAHGRRRGAPEATAWLLGVTMTVPRPPIPPRRHLDGHLRSRTC